MFKKIICVLMTLALVLGAFAACGGKTNEPAATTADKTEDSGAPTAEDAAGTDDTARRFSIVTTIFPVYDWVRNLLGDRAADCDITMLLDSGVDLHNYQPTAADILKVSHCDLFLYVGGESDEWVEDVLAQAENRDMLTVNLLETLGDRVKEEEVKEGMEAEHDHDHDHDGDEAEEAEHDHDHEEEAEYDEHVWLSVKNAAALCGVIAGKLGEMDEGNKAVYDANADAYIEKLNALDADYQAAVDAAAVKTVVFGDRFPFRYLVDDYGLDYYAAFVGCSAESEASFETVVFLANKIDELGLHAILQIETADGRIADTVRQNTAAKDQTVLTMDSLQSVDAGRVAQGVDYLSVMRDNLAVLQQALQ
jgi:zinc transport system substrate-binding protein